MIIGTYTYKNKRIRSHEPELRITDSQDVKMADNDWRLVLKIGAKSNLNGTCSCFLSVTHEYQRDHRNCVEDARNESKAVYQGSYVTGYDQH